jgi:transcriptional regulator with XRE-family HTH domain
LPDSCIPATIRTVPEHRIRETLFRETLCREFEARRQKNRRYSLRAFAAFLGTDHSTLSQILRGTRRIPASCVSGWATRLGRDREEITVYLAAERSPDVATAAAHEELRNWTAEAVGLATECAHWQILRLSSTPEFRADSRWLAKQIGVSVDQVNLALTRLLRLGLLRVRARNQWTDLTGRSHQTERDFPRMALARLRKSVAEARHAAEAHVGPPAK